ncbi:MAG: hypothetical protein ACRD3W_17390, partial [Terriglobales bacterium]
DLESVLIGQKLLRDGCISVAQFQVAMELSGSRGKSISDMLVEKGYISYSELNAKLDDNVEEAAPPQVVTIREVPIAPKAQEEKKADGNNGPAWRDQLDWGAPELAESLPESGGAQGLGALLSSTESETEAAVGTEQLSATGENVAAEGAIPAERALDVKSAVPSWRDQLDWSDAESEQAERAAQEAQTENFAPEPDSAQSMAASASESEPVSRSGAAAEGEETPSLRLSNAVPTWKDQLDWGAPEHAAGAEHQVEAQQGQSRRDEEPADHDRSEEREDESANSGESGHEEIEPLVAAEPEAEPSEPEVAAAADEPQSQSNRNRDREVSTAEHAALEIPESEMLEIEPVADIMSAGARAALGTANGATQIPADEMAFILDWDSQSAEHNALTEVEGVLAETSEMSAFKQSSSA